MKTAQPDLVVEANPAPADENATHGLKRKYWMGDGWRIRVRLPDGLYAYEEGRVGHAIDDVMAAG